MTMMDDAHCYTLLLLVGIHFFSQNCLKHSLHHSFHEDRPVRTGGGFTYFKKDRPANEMSSRNPMNWKIQHPDLALKTLMEGKGDNYTTKLNNQ